MALTPATSRHIRHMPYMDYPKVRSSTSLLFTQSNDITQQTNPISIHILTRYDYHILSLALYTTVFVGTVVSSRRSSKFREHLLLGHSYIIRDDDWAESLLTPQIQYPEPNILPDRIQVSLSVRLHLTIKKHTFLRIEERALAEKFDSVAYCITARRVAVSQNMSGGSPCDETLHGETVVGEQVLEDGTEEVLSEYPWRVGCRIGDGEQWSWVQGSKEPTEMTWQVDIVLPGFRIFDILLSRVNSGYALLFLSGPRPGREAGKRWLHHLWKNRADSWNSEESLNPEYMGALKACILARDEIRGGYLRWSELPPGSAPLPDVFDLEWIGIQAERCYDPTAPLPVFSGEEIERRRAVIFPQIHDVFQQLQLTKRKILELHRARAQLTSEDQEGDKEYLLDRALEENSRRANLEIEWTRLDIVARDLLFLTAVALEHAC
ncbi:hypothetical protein K435DRAFT_879682 [Dendrothele bispora CBS 962.96]|uniref:Uncharacterized protein n=1 Tax=Dendrothele bispora (strain CBS 962.96) TaxID=1314807 RepID=A0A4S8KKP9_DENBC|nr:hypothetical protein K435DRAFT_879682 [Dendrothele bispora CBS 962.96]